jgi:hypothetical protein
MHVFGKENTRLCKESNAKCLLKHAFAKFTTFQPSYLPNNYTNPFCPQLPIKFQSPFSKTPHQSPLNPMGALFPKKPENFCDREH